MKYEAVIFDLDGTLLNTLDDLADSLNYTLKKNGLPERTRDEVRLFVGNGIRKLMERGVPAGTEVDVIDKVHSDFTEHYKIHCNDKTRPYDSVLDILAKLKNAGVKLAVLSNKADYAVQDLCVRYFEGLIDVAAGEIIGIPKKPSPEGVYNTLEKLGVTAEKCVYIGDSDVDVLTAKNSNMDCIAVDWGFRDRDVLVNAGAEIIVSSPEKLFEELIK